MALAELPRTNVQGVTLKRVIDSYLNYYANSTAHTARAKRLDLDHFLSFLSQLRGQTSTTKLKVKDFDYSSVQRFVDASLAKGESPTTVARRLATLKHMGRTLAEQLPGFVNPAREVRPPRIRIAKPKALTLADVKAVRSRAKTRLLEKDSFIRKRNKVILEFLLETGLRADEVRLLKRGQLDQKLEWISNVRTKGRRFRNVYITSVLRPLLKKYLKERELELKKHFARLTKSKDKVLPVFISSYDCDPKRPESFFMGAKTLWRAVNELSARTPLHPHLLRHSFALDLLDDSGDVRLVAQALGHSDVRTTMRYTERRDQEVAEALERSRKRRKRK